DINRHICLEHINMVNGDARAVATWPIGADARHCHADPQARAAATGIDAIRRSPARVRLCDTADRHCASRGTQSLCAALSSRMVCEIRLLGSADCRAVGPLQLLDLRLATTPLLQARGVLGNDAIRRRTAGQPL